MFEQRGDRLVAALPEQMHVALGIARTRAERRNCAAFDAVFFTLAVVQTGFQISTATIDTQPEGFFFTHLCDSRFGGCCCRVALRLPGLR
ncbi:hypothetical protein D3C76_1411210 [compost metagenome]